MPKLSVISTQKFRCVTLKHCFMASSCASRPCASLPACIWPSYLQGVLSSVPALNVEI